MDGVPGEGWQYGDVVEWDGQTLGFDLLSPFKTIAKGVVGVVKKVAKPLVGVATSIIPGGGIVRTALNVGGSLLRPGTPSALAVPVPRPVLRLDPRLATGLADRMKKIAAAAKARKAGDVEGAKRLQAEAFAPVAPSTPATPPFAPPPSPTGEPSTPAPGDGAGKWLVPALVVGGLFLLSRRGSR
jgi:MYXO-CTERM domain-containing protein